MTKYGKCVGALAVLPIAVFLYIGMAEQIDSRAGFEHAWRGLLRATFFAPIALNLAATWVRIAGGAASFAALTVSPQVLAESATALPFWPIAAVAVVAAWLVRVRNSRWPRIALDVAEPAATVSEPPLEFAPEPLAAAVPPLLIPAAPIQAQGADLAARARFVAMSFAYPEAGLALPHARPGPGDWPLQLRCQPTRFTVTLHHAALSYRLEFSNRGAEPLGPLIIRADLVAGQRQIAPHRHAGFADDDLPLCHYLDGLRTGDSIALTGELRLPLAGITAMRLGSAELLVPLMRLCAESAGDGQPVLSVSAGFAIGLPPLSAGGGIQPFRLDSGPAIWRKLTARRLIYTEMS